VGLAAVIASLLLLRRGDRMATSNRRARGLDDPWSRHTLGLRHRLGMSSTGKPA